MHAIQPKHVKLKKQEVDELVSKLNISVVQLPKISKEDVCVPKDCITGDVVKITRIFDDQTEEYYRVVS